MSTAVARRPEKPKPYSITPKGKPHLRIVHVPYHYSQLMDLHYDFYTLPKGCVSVDWQLRLDDNPEWIFVIDVSKDDLDDGNGFVHDPDFDFRSMLGQGK
jgi:hypothetical protein